MGVEGSDGGAGVRLSAVVAAASAVAGAVAADGLSAVLDGGMECADGVEGGLGPLGAAVGVGEEVGGPLGLDQEGASLLGDPHPRGPGTADVAAAFAGVGPGGAVSVPFVVQPLEFVVGQAVDGVPAGRGGSGGGAGVEESDGGLGLLRYDSVAKGLELLGTGKSGDVGDVAGGQAHEPLDEGGAQAASIVSCPGGGAAEGGLPAGDGGGELAPITFTTTSFSGLAFVPMRFDSPDFQSRAAGVGRSVGASEFSDGRTAAPGLGDWLLP
jgi:hypothetical protein